MSSPSATNLERSGGQPADRAGGGSGLPPGLPGTVATVGTFDGVHVGHRAILERAADRAAERGLASLLVTFDRHPLEVVRPAEAPGLLTTPGEKLEALAQGGPDYVALLPFTRRLSLYGPDEFVRHVLLERLRVRELVVGPDHGFGRSRAGDLKTLRRLGAGFGFAVHVVQEVEVDGAPVSSTRVRRLLCEGRPEEVARLLGRPYALRGRVVRGSGWGRRLGFPTANLALGWARKIAPADGIYAVRASLGRELRDGLLHAGPRPTFADAQRSLELHVLEFEGELYGAQVQVELLRRLREVRGFDSPEALVRQMQRDREEAVRFFQERDRREAGGA